MKPSKPTHYRILSSFRKEAAAAIRGHWFISLLITLIATLIPVLPYAALVLRLAWTPMPLVEAPDFETAMRIMAPIIGFSLLAAFAAFLLSPILIVAMNKLSARLMNGEKVSLRTVFPSPREWARSLRVSILGFIYSIWPVLLGSLIITLVTPLLMNSAQAEGLSRLPGAASSSVLLQMTPPMMLPLLALMIYSVTRFISYIPAQYLLALMPGAKARTLLKTSRRSMRGYKGRLFLLELSFIGWLMLSSLVPSLINYLLNFLPAGLVNANAVALLIPGLSFLFSLPLTVYINTSIMAFVMHLPCDA